MLRFKEPLEDGPRFKIPQIGWNRIQLPGDGADPGLWENTILQGIQPGRFFYFVHSYYCAPEDETHVLAKTEYGRDSFCSAVNRGHIWGCQFHPERSAAQGIHIYKTLLSM